MDAEALTRFRSLLDEERAFLRAQIAEHGGDPDDPERMQVEFEEAFADSGQAASERAEAIAVLEGLHQNLHAVDQAVARIEAGTYGRCTRCGKEIGLERLEAIPSSALCIECKQRYG